MDGVIETDKTSRKVIKWIIKIKWRNWTHPLIPEFVDIESNSAASAIPLGSMYTTSFRSITFSTLAPSLRLSTISSLDALNSFNAPIGNAWSTLCDALSLSTLLVPRYCSVELTNCSDNLLWFCDWSDVVKLSDVASDVILELKTKFLINWAAGSVSRILKMWRDSEARNLTDRMPVDKRYLFRRIIRITRIWPFDFFIFFVRLLISQ